MKKRKFPLLPSTSYLRCIRELRKYNVPDSRDGELYLYLRTGKVKSDFILGLMQHDERKTIKDGTLYEVGYLEEFQSFVNHCFPEESHGNPEKVIKWREHRKRLTPKLNEVTYGELGK